MKLTPQSYSFFATVPSIPNPTSFAPTGTLVVYTPSQWLAISFQNLGRHHLEPLLANYLSEEQVHLRPYFQQFVGIPPSHIHSYIALLLCLLLMAQTSIHCEFTTMKHKHLFPLR